MECGITNLHHTKGNPLDQPNLLDPSNLSEITDHHLGMRKGRIANQEGRQEDQEVREEEMVMAMVMILRQMTTVSTPQKMRWEGGFDEEDVEEETTP